MSDPEDAAREEVDAFLNRLKASKPAPKQVDDSAFPNEEGEDLKDGGELLTEMMKEERFARLKPGLRAAILADCQSDIHELGLASMLAFLALQLVEEGLKDVTPDTISKRGESIMALASAISSRAYDLTQNTRLVKLTLHDVPGAPDNISDESFKLYLRAIVEHVNEVLATTPESTPVCETEVNHVQPKREK